jgi:hypothetical protein
MLVPPQEFRSPHLTPFAWSSGLTIQFAAQIAHWFPNLGILTRPQKMLHHGTRVRFEQN